MTDLERFVDLYKSFGINCNVNKEEDGFVIVLGENEYVGSREVKVTSGDKLGGYSNFFSTIRFDGDGKFLKQEFWE